MWNKFIIGFFKTGAWFPILLIAVSGIVYYFWGISTVGLVVIILYGLWIVFIGLRHVYYWLFKKGYYANSEDKDSSG